MDSSLWPESWPSRRQTPEWFDITYLLCKALDKAGMTNADIDLWELNEAFSVVGIANNQALGLRRTSVSMAAPWRWDILWNPVVLESW